MSRKLSETGVNVKGCQLLPITKQAFTSQRISCDFLVALEFRKSLAHFT